MSTAPGMAFPKPPDTEKQSFEKTVAVKRLKRVGAATWVEAAFRAGERGNHIAVKQDRCPGYFDDYFRYAPFHSYSISCK